MVLLPPLPACALKSSLCSRDVTRVAIGTAQVRVVIGGRSGGWKQLSLFKEGCILLSRGRSNPPPITAHPRRPLRRSAPAARSRPGCPFAPRLPVAPLPQAEAWPCRLRWAPCCPDAVNPTPHLASSLRQLHKDLAQAPVGSSDIVGGHFGVPQHGASKAPSWMAAGPGGADLLARVCACGARSHFAVTLQHAWERPWLAWERGVGHRGGGGRGLRRELDPHAPPAFPSPPLPSAGTGGSWSELQSYVMISHQLRCSLLQAAPARTAPAWLSIHAAPGRGGLCGWWGGHRLGACPVPPLQGSALPLCGSGSGACMKMRVGGVSRGKESPWYDLKPL